MAKSSASPLLKVEPSVVYVHAPINTDEDAIGAIYVYNNSSSRVSFKIRYVRGHKTMHLNCSHNEGTIDVGDRLDLRVFLKPGYVIEGNRKNTFSINVFAAKERRANMHRQQFKQAR
jgi:hypothetical protein